MKKKTVGIIILMAMLLTMICLVSACSSREESPKQEDVSTATVSETTAPETTPETKPETKPEPTTPEAKSETKSETKSEVKSETKPETTSPEVTPETKPETKPESTAPETKPEPKPTEPPKPRTPTIDQSTCKHQWPDWTITKLPTETATGMKERVCPICGAKETEVMPIVNVQEGGDTDHWGESISEHNYDGTITQAQFDEFVAYATSQGFVFSNSTAYHTDYDLNKSETIFPRFTIIDSTESVYITVWISPDGSGSDDHRLCHSIDQLYEFFNLYKDR